MVPNHDIAVMRNGNEEKTASFKNRQRWLILLLRKGKFESMEMSFFICMFDIGVCLLKP